MKKVSKSQSTPRSACCVFCGRELSDGYGNNAEPVAIGECCDDCNMEIVVPARIELMRADAERR